MMWDDFMWRALAAGLVVAAVAGPLGSFVVWRRMAYFGSTLSHAALLGVALALMLDVSPMLGVGFVSVLCALLLFAYQGNSKLADDTVLGILAHGALALGLVLSAFLQNVRFDLMGYLFGDILSVSQSDIYWMSGGALGVLGVLMWLWRPLLSLSVHAELAFVEGVNVKAVRLAYMLLLALVVALALKVVGVLLVASLLIIPPATARRFARTPESMAVIGGALGCLAVVLGLSGAFAFDTPAGPSIVVGATALFVVSHLWPAQRAAF